MYSFYQDKFYRLLTDVAFIEKQTSLQSVILKYALPQQLIPFRNQHNKHILFHYDNARPHRTNVITSFLNKEQHNTWPALSKN